MKAMSINYYQSNIIIKCIKAEICFLQTEN